MFLRGQIHKRLVSQVSPFGGGLRGRIFSKPEAKTQVSIDTIILPLDPPPKGEGRTPQVLIYSKIPASSIAEVVIALTIIALCFSVASLIFIRSINVSTRFQDIRKQTEIQSKIMESLYRDNDSIPLIEMEDITVKTVEDESDEKMNVIEFLGTDNRMIWKQQVLKNSGK